MRQIIEYICQNCGHEWTRKPRVYETTMEGDPIFDKHEVECPCPECGSEETDYEFGAVKMEEKKGKLERLERKINALYALVTTWARKEGIDVEKVIKETRERRRST